MVRTLDLRLRGRGFNFLQASCSHTHTVVSGIGTGLRAVMPCGWEGNRRSGIALAMQHSLKGTLRRRLSHVFCARLKVHIFGIILQRK